MRADSIIIGLSQFDNGKVYISEMWNAKATNSSQSVGYYEILPSEHMVLLRLVERIKARDKLIWKEITDEPTTST